MKQRTKLAELYLKSAKEYLIRGDYEIIKIEPKRGKKTRITIKEKKDSGILGNS